ncbi:unnamed protein product [Hermetia illucens]|uniref:G-protein coupled receptors family 3 profile domain-containing protein n=1 Tax=Hermetia illucens TaxID=343691 RepID=A0A7R8V787_HERIL|nr:metabotropic glutamate receptor 7-like isoform X2 [Hermetia illucens]CAD7094167.1 unnamed protein product [Hermetia illucens]
MMSSVRAKHVLGRYSSFYHFMSIYLLLYAVNSVIIVNVRAENLEHNGKIIRITGDIILGGIFPMHEHSLDGARPDYPCGAVKEEKGVQRLEAMLYAVDLINADPHLLPNTTIGVLIIDSCSSDTYALEQSMEFVRYYMNQDMSEYKCDNGKTPTYVPHKPVVGVIGASFSTVSIMVANILRLFKIPQISYASTSTELSDKSRFEYFSRVVPPDNFQAQAMAEIVRALNWLYVSTVAVEGDYGEKGIASFVKIAGKLGICIAISEKVSRNSKIDDFDRIIDNLSKANARAIVMFVDEDNVRKLLQASVRANRTGYFYWIASDSWGAKVHPVRDQEEAAVNTITVLPHRTNLDGFDRYYKSLRPKTNSHSCTSSKNIRQSLNRTEHIINCRNVWFNEFWEQHNKCTFDMKGPKVCNGQETVDGYDQEGLVPFVVDAVYAMAHALHNIVEHYCGHMPYVLCDIKEHIPGGAELLKYIHNVSFIGQQGTKVRFNQDGDAFGFYNIYQYQKRSSGRYDYVQIGTWKEELELKRDQLFFELGVPRLICSEDCPLGSVRNHQDQCCWSCVECREDAYVSNDTCVSCKPGFAPNEHRTGCKKIKPEVIQWDDPWAVVPLAVSVFGILSTIFTASIFIKYNHTPVIKASGRELCYLLLTGTLFCYGMTFVILGRPGEVMCSCVRLGLGLGLSMCYGAILVKTNRISRIFNMGVKTVKRPLYISPLSQVLIWIAIVAFQLTGATLWLWYDRASEKEIYPQSLVAVLMCKASQESMVLSLGFNMLLIVLCTVYAFKTRKIPENFNEAKYIGFTMYSTCIVWLAFLPIYFGSNSDYKMQLASLCMCISISAYVVVGCLFTPKVYLVLFQPDKNVRPGPGNQLAMAGKEIPGRSSSVGLRFRSNVSNNQLSHTQQSITSPESPYTTTLMPSTSGIGLSISQTVSAPTISQTVSIPTISQTMESNVDEEMYELRKINTSAEITNSPISE